MLFLFVSKFPVSKGPTLQNSANYSSAWLSSGWRDGGWTISKMRNLSISCHWLPQTTSFDTGGFPVFVRPAGSHSFGAGQGPPWTTPPLMGPPVQPPFVRRIESDSPSAKGPCGEEVCQTCVNIDFRIRTSVGRGSAYGLSFRKQDGTEMEIWNSLFS